MVINTPVCRASGERIFEMHNKARINSKSVMKCYFPMPH
ncbi:hypothetical protein ECH7EC4076_1310 [Escherichia coli O157:H7 str. EC4076]|nr:hypothetical protein ECH7EC4076_1310 [Escherichia coli O157:H7 str. EC4076]